MELQIKPDAVLLINESGEEVELYKPLPHQLEAHASAAPNRLELGTRGTGKSVWLRWDSILRCLMCPNFHALIVRRTMPELRETHLTFIEAEMKQLGGTYLHTTFVAKFPNGSTITFGHCETDADVLNYLGRQYGFIGFDEVSTFTLDQFLLISSACRAKESDSYKATVRCSSNPLGIGADWMYEWFVDKTVDLRLYPDYRPEDFEYGFSTLEQNPHLDRKTYAARLRNLPEHIRRAWLLGERVIEGAYFPEFRKSKLDDDQNEHEWHVISQLPTYKGQPLFACEWLKVYRAIDWGYFPDPCVCLWFVVLPNKRVYAFKERTWKQTLAEDIAKSIVRESEGMNLGQTFADPSMFLRRGDMKATGYSIADIFEVNHVPLTPSINDRALYGYAIHEFLNTLIEGEPRLQIVQGTCPELTRTLPLMRTDKNDPTKLADGEDHWVCGTAYFCIGEAPPSREPSSTTTPRWMRPKLRLRIRYRQPL